jgi:hypothetical protein
MSRINPSACYWLILTLLICVILACNGPNLLDDETPPSGYTPPPPLQHRYVAGMCPENGREGQALEMNRCRIP